ncbi:uncharacterized protein LOC131694025 [Topomyia yanbarensis]|uniref:uncharacterized protein LOC131694025 n=1 Tax=Topomyia yanbarensis TaxID=2498891 RepID=UPI00273CCC32|nr:uncharacterized protein LOC131694025 [Topomyia yanbarensis]
MKTMSSWFAIVTFACLAAVSYAAPQANYPVGTRVESIPIRNDRDGQDTENNNVFAKKSDRHQDDETLEEIQAKSAQYSYDSSINDSISDQTVTRQETRDGLALKGMFAYSDGFYKREVHYVADDKGYRVVKEITIPIGDGPRVDPNGKADVSSSLSGSYSITADDIARPVKKIAKKVDTE